MKKRFQIKIQKYFRVLNKHISTAETVDLGVENPFQNHKPVIRSRTLLEDLDLDQSVFSTDKQNVVTAFEIFEHLLNPYTILSEINPTRFSYQYQCVCGFHQLQK
jgi:hypothetical protein